jgi:hypothetical protein
MPAAAAHPARRARAMGPHQRLFDPSDLRRVRAEFLREARALPPGDERNEKRQIARGLRKLNHIQRDRRDSTAMTN